MTDMTDPTAPSGASSGASQPDGGASQPDGGASQPDGQPSRGDPATTVEERTAHDEPADAQRGPTAAQLRRFIKSRPYVPLHELRRRFELNGDLDEVSRVELAGAGAVFVGLPQREAEYLASLVRDGDIGVELSQDPTAPIVVGVFPMRPVTRG